MKTYELRHIKKHGGVVDLAPGQKFSDLVLFLGNTAKFKGHARQQENMLKRQETRFIHNRAAAAR